MNTPDMDPPTTPDELEQQRRTAEMLMAALSLDLDDSRDSKVALATLDELLRCWYYALREHVGDHLPDA